MRAPVGPVHSSGVCKECEADGACTRAKEEEGATYRRSRISLSRHTSSVAVVITSFTVSCVVGIALWHASLARNRNRTDKT